MDKTWKQLEQRCKLFAEGPDGLFVELLKEAECELANKCSLLTRNDFFNGESVARPDGDSSVDGICGILMPSTYKSIIAVYCNGKPLRRGNFFNKNHLTQTKAGTELSLIGSSYGYGIKINTGEPSFYDVVGNRIIFNSSKNTDKYNVIYKSNLVNSDKVGKRIRCVYATASSDGFDSETDIIEFGLDTSLETELNGYTFHLRRRDEGSGFAVSDIEYDSTNRFKFKASSVPYDLSASDNIREYDVTSDYTKSHSATHTNVFLTPFKGTLTKEGVGAVELAPQMTNMDGEILNYRALGPVIDNDYHLSLCDYAISIALAKKSQQISDKHRMLWEKTIRETLDDNLERDLPLTIKEEI